MSVQNRYSMQKPQTLSTTCYVGVKQYVQVNIGLTVDKPFGHHIPTVCSRFQIGDLRRIVRCSETLNSMWLMMMSQGKLLSEAVINQKEPLRCVKGVFGLYIYHGVTVAQQTSRETYRQTARAND